MSSSLTIFLLPLIAALIGYFTNWVAIRMLFRPLKEKRIFGIRIPFTPGLIPRKRRDIANNIGKSVAENLLTTEAVSERLESKEVKAQINITIYNWLEQFLEKDWGAPKELVPAKLRPQWEQLVGKAEDRTTALILDFLRSEQAEELLDQLLREAAEQLKHKQLEEILDEDSQQALIELLRDQIDEKVEDGSFEGKVEEFWQGQLDKLTEGEGQVGDYVSPELERLIYEKAEDLLPPLLVKTADFLEDPQLRKKIKMYLFDLVDELVEKEFKEDSVWDQLKLGVLETFVMSVDKMKLRIDEAVDRFIPQLAELLGQEEIRQQIVDSLKDYVEDFLQKDVQELRLQEERQEKIVDGLSRGVVSLARNERLRSSVMGYLRNGLEELGKREIGSLLPLEDEEKLRPFLDSLKDYLLESLRSEATAEKVEQLVRQKSEELRSKEIGRLDRYVEAEWLDPLVDYTVDVGVDFLKRETPEIMSTLNVAKLVRKEVDTFSLREVEGLILDVTGNQLRAITWFGALLGFFIGLVQIAIITLG